MRHNLAQASGVELRPERRYFLTLGQEDLTSVNTQTAVMVFGTIAALAVTALVLFRIGMRRWATVMAVIAVLGLANAIYRLVGS